MRKVKFDIGGIVMKPRSNDAKRLVVRGVIGCAGVCALALATVFGGGFFPHTLSSVLNAFEKTYENNIIEEPQSQINFDKNLSFSFKEAPIKYAIPKVKIDNALSFEIGNSSKDLKFKSITFTVGEDACNSISRAYLSEENSDEINYAKCEDGLLKIDSLNKRIEAGETSKFTLTVSLNDKAKVGQHLNFSINNSRDIEAVIGFDNVYLPSVYPMKISTIYVVGLKFALN